MKTFLKLITASIIGLMALTSISYAGSQGKKYPDKKVKDSEKSDTYQSGQPDTDPSSPPTN